MYYNLKSLIKGEQVYPKYCVGKTIQDMYIVHGQVCIVFNDKTFCLMEEYTDEDYETTFENVDIDESNAIDAIRYDAYLNEFNFSGIMEFLIKNKLFERKELVNKFSSMKKAELERIKRNELSEYERIKEKYNLI